MTRFITPLDVSTLTVLPIGFIPIHESKYPGYFWDLIENKLYSIKSGTLKPLKMTKWKGQYYYSVSVNGTKKYLLLPYLRSKLLRSVIDKANAGMLFTIHVDY